MLDHIIIRLLSHDYLQNLLGDDERFKWRIFRRDINKKNQKFWSELSFAKIPILLLSKEKQKYKNSIAKKEKRG